MSTLDANTLYNSLSSQWNYTTTPRVSQFIKLFDMQDRAYAISINQIVYVDRYSRSVGLTSGDALVITEDSMSRLLSTLDCE